jgi:uncharacterized protein with PIN domain
MKFLADCMLGKLARWLRILGHDVAYDNQINDDALLFKAIDENRILLTRDRPLYARAGAVKVVHIDHDDLDSQIAQLVSDIDLDLYRPTFTRCLHCNVLINEVSPDEARASVPPFVLRSQSRIYHCPSCDRYYWPGSHFKRMNDRLSRIQLAIERDA